MSILLVDDDRDLVELLGFAFRRAGLDVVQAYDSPTALELVERERPELVVLDLNLGSWDGLDLLKELRLRIRVPVIVLSARGDESQKVLALDQGADDYVTKPFNHRELIARIRAHLRRQGEEWTAPSPAAAMLRVGPISLNVAEHTTMNDGRPVQLTVTEFRLLHYLMLNVGTVVPRQAIIRHVWGFDDPGGDVLRVTVHRLRRKIETDSSNPRFLHTVPGVGVVLRPELS